MFTANRSSKGLPTAVDGINITLLARWSVSSTITENWVTISQRAYLGTVHGMKAFKKSFERSAQLVEECGLASPDCVATTFRRAYEPEHGIGGRVYLKGMISVKLGTIVGKITAVTEIIIRSMKKGRFSI